MQAGAYFDAIRTLPIATVHHLTGGKPFVVLSPHPDDETLGTGGLIAHACAQGQAVDVVVVTDGAGSHPCSKTHTRQTLIDLRCSEVEEAGRALGLQPGHLTFLGLPDTLAPISGPQFEIVVEATLKVVHRAGAGTLFVTWEGDPHCDHEAAAELAKEVRRRCPDLKLWAYPIWGWHREANSETRQPPPRGFRIDISSWQVRKNAAIAAHASQMTDLIKDDPSGFRFDSNSIAPFVGPFEYFIEVPV